MFRGKYNNCKGKDEELFNFDKIVDFLENFYE
jgi:hypothetical protein